MEHVEWTFKAVASLATISSGCVLSVIAQCFSIVIKKIKISEPLKSKAVTELFKMRLHLRYITAVQNVCFVDGRSSYQHHCSSTGALEVQSSRVQCNTVWNELCHGPDISRYEPVFLRKTEVWRGIGFRTRSVYIEYQDPYFSWIELFPRHGISDIRTRHWNAACQDL